MLAGKSLASIASKGMVLPTSARAAAPAHLEILRKRFDQVSIAVVGSSGTLLYGEESVGVEIDAHDVIVRVNQAPAQHWEAEVGSRTDVRVTYSAGLENIQRQERSGWPHIVTPGELLSSPGWRCHLNAMSPMLTAKPACMITRRWRSARHSSQTSRRLILVPTPVCGTFTRRFLVPRSSRGYSETCGTSGAWNDSRPSTGTPEE